MAERERLYFFWDYDITEADLRAILAGEDDFEKAWAISRLLEAARWEDIWRYIGLRQIRALFPSLKLRREVREVWEYALQIWKPADGHA